MSLDFIPYGKQNINASDIEAVVQVLQSDWLTQGPAVPRFEQAVAAYCGVRYAVAVSNATAALHIACLAAGLHSNDVLWTSPNTFVASANCALYCGAKVDFIDIDQKTYNLSIVALEKKLHEAKKKGYLPKIVAPIHFAGQSCEMEQIKRLSKHYGFQIIEDASHAIGGTYKNTRVGSCVFSDMTVFSFHPVKLIATGEGGMVLTNRQDLYERLVRLRTHGITRDPALFQGTATHGPWYYQQIELGFNFRMTDLQAALGSSQLTRLDTFVERRRFLAKRYDELLSMFPVIRPWQNPETMSPFHLYVLRLKLAEIKKTQRQIFEEMISASIGVNLHYIPVHTHPYYQGMGFNLGDFPESERYYREAITLPLYFDLTEREQDRIVASLKKALQ